MVYSHIVYAWNMNINFQGFQIIPPLGKRPSRDAKMRIFAQMSKVS